MAKDIIQIEFKPTGDGVLIDAIQKLDKATKSLVKAQASLVKEGNKNRNNNKSNASSVEKLEIKLKALNSSFKKAKISTDLQTKALNGDRVALEKLRLATNKYIKTATKASASTRILGGTFAVLRSKLLIVNFMMGLGVSQLIRLGKQSAKLDSMKVAFDTMSKGADNGAKSLEKLRKATQNTMSDFDLLQQANNALVLGVSDSSDTMAKMFDVAQRLGQALGRDTASSVESLITGIGRQSRLMLDNIGIIVDTEASYAIYAQQLNKTTDALTDAEKKQAFLNATMKSAEDKVAVLGEKVVNTQNKFNQLGTSLSNTGATIGGALNPLLVFLASGLTKASNAINEVLTKSNAYNIALKNQNNAISALKISYADQIVFLKNYSSNFEAVAENIRQQTQKQITAEKKGILSMINFLDMLKMSKEELDQIRKDETTRSKAFGELTKGMGDEQIKRHKNAINAIVEAMVLQAKERDLVSQSMKDEEEYSKTRQTIIKKLITSLEKQQKILNENLFENRSRDAEEEIKALKQKIASLKDANDTLIRNKEIQQELADREMSRLEISARITGDNFNLQIAQLEEWAEKSKSLYEVNAEEKLLIDQYVEEQRELLRQKRDEDEATSVLNTMNLAKQTADKLLGFHQDNVNRRRDNAIKALQDSDAYENASSEKRKTMEKEVNKSFAKEEKRLFEMKKLSALAEIGMTTAKNVTKAGINPFLQALYIALGTAQASVVLSQQPPKYEQGGLVGGNRHSQGGTMIEAERGEFVMSRNAVESIGTETLNQMNESGNTGITINISAPLVDETVIDSIIPAIDRARRMNLA